jgi:hypothetical protein
MLIDRDLPAERDSDHQDRRPTAITLVALCGETYPKRGRSSRIRGLVRKDGKGSRSSEAGM